ncbi:MAG TPA: protein kinase [Myxococcus sp.]|nr:protein kinase [Myxococcus sp.]
MTLEAGTQIGKYVIRRKLAEGGMAEIYLCTARGPEGFEKEVVIKRVRAFLASDPEFVGMFIAEARLASRLNHANVVQIFDFDKHEDTYYLAMEYVRGCSLWELRKRCKELMVPVPPMLVAHIGAEVARGLHYAHRLRVNGQPLDLVHRDVTPHNVLLAYEGAVKLTDFGIAKAGNRLTQPGVLKGKFAYMSPEQARGEPVDARTDVFALGVVLWEMLTGGRLFDGDSEVAVLRAVQQSAIPPPARLNPDVPADLDAAIVRALEREPSARFQTAGELERALAQCVLKHATSVDDTDLPAFLRRLFPTTLTQQMLPAVQERTHVVEDAPAPGAGQAAAPASERREPTAVMKGSRGGSGAGSAPSPDEDASAATFVLPRQGEEPLEAFRPPFPPTPLMPLPAVVSSLAPRAGAEALPGEVGQGSAGVSGPGSVSGARAVVPSEGVGLAEGGSSGSAVGPFDGVSSVSGAKARGSAEGVPSSGAGMVGSSGGAPHLSSARADGSEAGARPGAEASVSPPGAPTGIAAERQARGGGPAPMPRRRPLALGLTLALSLATVGVAVAVLRSRPASEAPGPVASDAPRADAPAAQVAQAATPEAPRAVGQAPAPEAAGKSTAPTETDSDAELEGLRREEALGAGPAPAATETPPARASTAAVATGTLQVLAAPYATVFLNGKRHDEVVGRASYKLPPGTYRLVFQHPAGEKRFDVTITAGTTVTREFRAPRGR